MATGDDEAGRMMKKKPQRKLSPKLTARVPQNLFDRFKHLLYVTLAEEFGIDRDTLMLKKTIGRYHPVTTKEEKPQQTEVGDHPANFSKHRRA